MNCRPIEEVWLYKKIKFLAKGEKAPEATIQMGPRELEP